MNKPKKLPLASGEYLALIKLDGYEMVERINCTGVTAIVAITDKEEIVLVEQYRPPVGKHMIELPAGLVNDLPGMPHESLEDAAKRELLEETGFEAGEIKKLDEWPTSSGMTSETVTVFLATKLRRMHAGGGDKNEKISVHVVPLKDLKVWLSERRDQGIGIDHKIYAAMYLHGYR
jgi:ADP-ribose pyrophosphatase